MKRQLSKAFLLLLPILCSGMENVVPKEGGICFRFDDNQTIRKWNDMAAVFRPYGCKFGMSIISHGIHAPEYAAMLRDFQREGHEIMDHTASHAVFTLAARTPEERNEYEKHPDFDHWNGKKACFRSIPDPAGLSKPFRANAQGKRVFGFSDETARQLKRGKYLYHPQSKTACLYSWNNGELRLRSFWNEDTVDLPERNNTEFQMVSPQGGFPASDALLRLQAKVSAENFKRAGLRQPVSWIQPGGYEPVLTADNVRRVYAPLGYTGGATYPNAARKVYNEPEPERCRFAMMWGNFSLEREDISKLRHEIANRVALHQVLIGSSHMKPVPAVGWTKYLDRHRELLQWCKEKRIPVRTQSEWTERLYLRKPDPMYNLMPPLTVDRDEDGIPDGYLPAKTVTVENGAFLAKRSGLLFHIRQLTGMETGPNSLTFQLKGAPGTVIRVRIQPYIAPRKPAFTKDFTQTLETAAPHMETVRFDIPAGTRYLNLEFHAAKLPVPLSLGSFSLTKE